MVREGNHEPSPVAVAIHVDCVMLFSLLLLLTPLSI